MFFKLTLTPAVCSLTFAHIPPTVSVDFNMLASKGFSFFKLFKAVSPISRFFTPRVLSFSYCITNAWASVIFCPLASLVPTKAFTAPSKELITESTLPEKAAESTSLIPFSKSKMFPFNVSMVKDAADPLSTICWKPFWAIALNPWPALLDASINA